MKRPLKKRKAQGVIFYFKYDDDAPDLLHIYARHLTSEQDAIDAFFYGETVWNQKRERFETHTKTHKIYWFWLDEVSKRVMIISCFTL